MSLQTSELQNSASGCIYANAYDASGQGRRLPDGTVYVGSANGHDWKVPADDFTQKRVMFSNWMAEYSLQNLPRVRVSVLSNGTAAPYTSVGSYPILYVDAGDCVLCPSCALELEGIGEPMQAGGVNYGEPTYCEECNDEIETAYPDSDGDDENDPGTWEFEW